MLKKKTDNWNTIKKEVLKKIIPEKKTVLKEQQTIKEIKKQLKKICEKNVKIGVFGSFARNTHLKTEKDIDVFLLYPTKTSIKKIEKKIFETGKKFFKNNFWTEYSEHPYIKGYWKNFLVEIVPAYALKNTEKLLSSADRTPFHHYYLKKRLNKKKCSEIRLLKSFLKALNCYGSKTSISGFSGYLSELLILKHGSFISLAKNASNWKEQTVIEIEKNTANKKFNHHFVVIDPIDPKRNTAAAVSLEQYSRFILGCRKFLENPSKKYFHVFKKQKGIKTIQKNLKDRNIVFLEMPVIVKGLIEVIGAQQKKIHLKLEKKLNENQFLVRKSSFYQGKKRLYHAFEFYSAKGPKSIVKTGPKITDKKNNEAFLKKHCNPVFGPWVKKDRLVLETKTITTNPEKFLKHAVKKLLKEEKPPILKALKKAKIITGKKIISKKPVRELKEFLEEVTRKKEVFF